MHELRLSRCGTVLYIAGNTILWKSTGVYFGSTNWKFTCRGKMREVWSSWFMPHLHLYFYANTLACHIQLLLPSNSVESPMYISNGCVLRELAKYTFKHFRHQIAQTCLSSLWYAYRQLGWSWLGHSGEISIFFTNALPQAAGYGAPFWVVGGVSLTLVPLTCFLVKETSENISKMYQPPIL